MIFLLFFQTLFEGDRRDFIEVKRFPDYEDKNVLLGKYNYRLNDDFVLVDDSFSLKKGIYIRKEVYDSFKKMFYDAIKDSIILKIVSGTRDFYEQKVIWEEKFQKYYKKGIKDTILICKEILKYTAMPGTSRHHWGTDIDILSTEKGYFESGYGLKVYKWIKENGWKYGFFFPYTESIGYDEGRWHLSYFPLSSKFYEKYILLVKYQDIKGFTGCEKAKELDIIENYVKNINKNLR
uniref:D-alanyl-D-alanine carboxypeptidase family protein n=1 Tax=candidate division WOR-3 bacterium TaxID=2052148 RepID=A0A7C4UCF9_UNCW3